MEKLGVAILGLDHWYSAEHMAPAVIDSAVTRLVAISHDDLAKGRQLIRNADDAFWTSDYHAALDRKDVDIVVLLYSTDRNVAICQEAAALGKHIVSVKPMALDLAGADAIVAAVRAAGVQFFPLESQRRLNPDSRRIKSWIDEGRIGRPLRFTQMLHGSLPMAWPGSSETGWWTDPDRVPGGAWLDHSIYAVDSARWLLGSEMAQVCGVSANQRYAELAVEDFGMATYTMDDGAVVLIEDTWTADRGYGFSRTELFGSAGTISEDSNLRGAVALRGDFGLEGALSLDLRRESRSLVVDHMVAVVRGETAPAATVDDGRANLAACLAFYEAAREGKSVQIRD
jgi:predicted dehydrogenase